MPDHAWHIGNLRRQIRALAAGVPVNQAALTPQAHTRGEGKRVQTIDIAVKAIPAPFVSEWSRPSTSLIPPPPTHPDFVPPTVDRVRAIVDLLFTGEPYGPLLGAWISIEWEHWRVSHGHRRRVTTGWMSVSMHQVAAQLMVDFQERLDALLLLGVTFAVQAARGKRESPTFEVSEAKRPPVEWIEVRNLSVHWTVDPGSYAMRVRDER